MAGRGNPDVQVSTLNPCSSVALVKQDRGGGENGRTFLTCRCIMSLLYLPKMPCWTAPCLGRAGCFKAWAVWSSTTSATKCFGVPSGTCTFQGRQHPQQQHCRGSQHPVVQVAHDKLMQAMCLWQSKAKHPSSPVHPDRAGGLQWHHAGGAGGAGRGSLGGSAASTRHAQQPRAAAGARHLQYW